MKNNNYQKGQSIQFLFTMLLLFFLCISALFTILFGAKVYENIGKREDAAFNSITPLCYISNKVKQADYAGMVSVETIEGINVLKLKEVYDDVAYNTLIYCKDGELKELFTNEGSGLTLDDGIGIMELKSMSFEMAEGQNLLKIALDDGKYLFLALRSGGAGHE